MKNLKELLGRISQALSRNDSVKEDFRKIILEETGVRLEKENVEYKNGVLIVSASPAAKNQIALKDAGLRNRLRNVDRIIYR